MTDAEIRNSSRLSAVWIVPLVAAVIGLWTVVQSYLERGPQVEVTFATAAGLNPGETKVRTLDVEIGVVETVQLAESFDEVTVVLRIDPSATELLTEDAQLWVVRPRVGSSGISGFATILSGAYIQLSPGTGAAGRRSYEGLEEPPVTAPGTPGLHLELLAESAGSISVGTPITHQGFKVGQVEQVTLDGSTGQSRLRVFVEQPYNQLVTSGTRFWNASGINMTASADGVSVNTESLESILTGGIAFAVPEGSRRGIAVRSGKSFFLFPSKQATSDQPHLFAEDYLLYFDASLRGLAPGAAVEYRGMRVGTVVEVGWENLAWSDLWADAQASTIPVVIALEPGWLGEDSQDAVDDFSAELERAVAEGLRASVSLSNLLTGSLYVNLDFATDAEPVELRRDNGMTVIPTMASGIDQIEQRVVGLLNKLQELPLQETLESANTALNSVDTSLADASSALKSVDTLLAAEDTQQLPASLVATLEETQRFLQGLEPGSPLRSELAQTIQTLRATLASAQALLETYEDKPNAFIFAPPVTEDPVPGEGLVDE